MGIVVCVFKQGGEYCQTCLLESCLWLRFGGRTGWERLKAKS